jgi:hypothetical protein
MKIKNPIFLPFLLLIVFSGLIAQANDTVIVHKDPRMDQLTAKQTQINKHASLLTSSGQYKGFRVQVVSTSNRDMAFKVKSDLLTRFPDQKSYALFQAPNFKVRIGNFLKKADAEKFKNLISKYYPTGVFIVEDAIDYTPTKDEEENRAN